MNDFNYSYPTRVQFGEGSVTQAFSAELDKVGETVMLAFGGGSVKKSGVYDEMKALLTQAGTAARRYLEHGVWQREIPSSRDSDGRGRDGFRNRS